MQQLLAVGLGGCVGALSRYWLSRFVDARLAPQGDFPWGILVVNALGCLLIGLLLGWTDARKDSLPDTARLFLATGLLGSLTTFSTFGHDTIRLVQQGHILTAAGNIGANVVLGLAAVTIGLLAIRAVS